MKINQNLTTVNLTKKNSTQRIKYIVVHYTGNNGDTAYSNTNYFKSTKRAASAHYFVDENEVWQSVSDGDIAWHCGTKGTYYHKKCRNQNSIGVELCSRVTGGKYFFKENTKALAIELIKSLMEKYNVPIENVVRHFDVTHKMCPEPFVREEWAWTDFLNKLSNNKEEDDMQELEKLRDDFDSQVKYYNSIINAVGAEIEALKNSNIKRFNRVDDTMPEWAVEEINYLTENKILVGDENGNLNLSEDDLRIFVSMSRILKMLKGGN